MISHKTFVVVAVLDQGERPVKLSTETAQARPTVQYIAEDEEVSRKSKLSKSLKKYHANKYILSLSAKNRTHFTQLLFNKYILLKFTIHIHDTIVSIAVVQCTG